MPPPANVPNSYHSSQTDTITKSDTHRSSEQTVHTETCRITETTMRMEHKSPLPDIEFNPTPPRPQFEIKEHLDTRTNQYADNSSHNKYTADMPSVPQYQQHTHSPRQNHTEYNHFVSNETLETQKYKPFEAAPQQQPHNEMAENPHTNNVTSNDGPMTAKPNYGSVFDKVKQIEKSTNDEPVYKPFKVGPTWNAASEPPLAQYNSDKPSEEAFSITPTYRNGAITPNPLNETIEQFSSKIHEFEKCHWSNASDLKAPALVKHVTPLIRPNDAPIKEKPLQEEPMNVPLNLQPGEPPELCFAPRVTSDRRSSLMEKIEKTLEKDLERGPTKVLPHSVRMIPPSPPPPPSQSTASEHFESSEHMIKQTKQYDITQPNKTINHIKNTFYENTTPPLHRNTFVHVPTPTKAPEKVRLWSVCSCVC